jgi:hypothetical protein
MQDVKIMNLLMAFFLRFYLDPYPWNFFVDTGERYTVHNSVAKFIVPDWGDKLNSGLGLSYRPSRQAT